MFPRGNSRRMRWVLLASMVLLFLVPLTSNPTNLTIDLEFPIIDFGPAGIGDDLEDFVDTISDLHPADTDVGTHAGGGFPEMQDKDGTFDLLTEQDTGGGGVDEYRYVDTYPADAWATTGASPYLDVQDQPTNIISTSSNGIQTNWIGFSATSGTGSGFTVVMSVYHSCDADSFIEWELDWTGDSTADASGTFSTGGGWMWEDDVEDLSALDTQAEIDATTIRFTHNKGSGGPDLVRIDAARLYITQAGGAVYDLDLEVGWTTADFDETNEYLCIFGGTQGSEALRVDIWDDVTTNDWVNVFADISAGWNNISLNSGTDYLDDTGFEIRFTDTSDEAVEADTWQIEGVLLHTWTTSYTPANDQEPTFDNPSDGDNAYAQYIEYQITVYVSDQNGFADIDYLEIGLWDDGQGTEYWRFRYDEDTDTFTEEYDSGTVVSLNTGGSSATEAGNDIDATFYFTVDWDHPDISETDAKCYVIDAQTEESTNWYEVNWDIETRLDYSVAPAVTSDDAGTVDIGDLDETFLLGGTLIYYTSTDDYPPSAQVDVWIAGSEYGSTPGPWSDLTLTSGAFEVTCYADDAVGQDTYTVKPVIESAGSGGTSLYYTTDLTDTYIATQVQVQSYSSDDGRININTAASDHVTLYYAHDSSYVTTGTVTVNGVSASYSGSNGVWDFGETKATVQEIVYDTVAISGDTHGITGEDQNSQTLNQIWDQIRIVSYTIVTPAGDNRVDISVTVTIDVELHYDFDETDVIDGTVTVNSLSTTYQSAGKWRFTDSEATVMANTYNDVQATGNAEGITVEDNTVTQQVIWDQVRVVSYTIVTPAGDNRVDISVTVTIDVELHYDFDETDVIDGTVTVNSLSTTYQSAGKWRFTDSEATVMANTYNDVQATGNAEGITVEDNTVTQQVIWDQVRVVSYTIVTPAGDSRVDISVTVTIDVELHYDYDETDVIDGTVTVNSLSTTYQSAGKWRFTDSEATVMANTYNDVQTTGNAEGITVEDNTVTQEIIWDRVQVQSYSRSDDRDNINDDVTVDVTLWYDYDDTLVIDGTVTINSISASHIGSGVWRITENEATVQLKTYDTVACSGNEHGITTVDDNSQSTTVIWDRIQVQTTVVDDGRLNINDNAEIRVTLWLDYNDEYLGSGDSVTLDGVAMSWDSGNGWFDLARTQASVGLWNYYVNSSSETTYGITVLDLNSQDVDVIFDRLNIDIQADDETPLNDVEVTFTLTVTFEYQTESCTTYEIAFTRDAIYWETFTNSNKSLFVDTNSDVSYDYTAGNINAESLYGITVFTTNTETVTWSSGANEVPVNDTAPTISNPDDTDNLYAKYRFYLITSYVSDQDGYTDIVYVELSLWDDARGTELWRVRYTVIGQVFSIELGAAYITLQYSGVTETGNDIDITWSIKIDWDHTDYTDIDTDQYVTDGSDTDQDWYESNWDTETRLDYSVTPYLSDDRGNINTADLQGDGTVIFYTSVDNYPLDNETDIWIVHDVSGEWSGDVDGSGAFTITSIGSSASVRQNTYTFKIVVSGAGSGGADLYYTTSLTDTFITDRIQVQTTVVDDPRVNIDDNVEIRVTLWLDYDDEYLGTGDSVTLDDVAMSWDSGNSWFDLTRTQASLGLWNYYVNSSSEATYGITALVLNSQDVDVIWDRIQVQSYSVSDDHDNINDNVDIDVTLWYDYDDTLVTDGTVTIEGIGAAHQGSGVWRITENKATVQLVTYNTVACSGNTHGLSTVDQNGQTQDVIWDKITVQTTVVDDPRVNVDGNAEIRVTLWLEYNDEYLGTGDSVTLDGVAMSWDGGNSWFDLTRTQSTVDIWKYYVNSSSEATYGITALEVNSQDVDVIWDRLNIDIQADDETPENGIEVTFTLTVTFEYDSGSCTTYEIAFDREAVYWETFTNVNKSLFVDTNSDVIYNYNASNVNQETLHGITVFTTNTETVTWAPGNYAPVNDTAPILTDPHDTDHMYAWIQYYTMTSNVSDQDGFTDIVYVELSLYDNARGVEVWRIRYTVIGQVFSVEIGGAYIDLSGSSVDEAGNDIDITWVIRIDWDHDNLADIDTKQYVTDGTDTDTDWYESDWEVETRLDILSLAISESRGKTSRNDLSITGTIIYFESASELHPTTALVDVWADGPVSDKVDMTLTDGDFSITAIESSATVNLDVHIIRIVIDGEGVGGTELSHELHTKTYISDMLKVTLSTSTPHVTPGVEVTIDVAVVYAYDLSAVSSYFADILRDTLDFVTINETDPSFTDMELVDTTHEYTISGANETLYGIELVSWSNSLTVIWGAEGVAGPGQPRTTDIPVIPPGEIQEPPYILMGISLGSMFLIFYLTRDEFPKSWRRG